MSRRSLFLSSMLALSLGWFAGCKETSLGAACETDADCSDGLVCDVHIGQGTCQDVHDHSEAADADTEEDTHGEDTHGDETEGATEGETADETTGDTDGSGCQEYMVGLSETGALVTATFVSADPVPVFKGDNTWVLAFTDAEGTPLDGLEIVVTPIMPEHGHGTPVEAIVTPTGNAGEYSIAPVNLFMAGLWEITFDVTYGDAQDSVMFSFCVE